MMIILANIFSLKLLILFSIILITMKNSCLFLQSDYSSSSLLIEWFLIISFLSFSSYLDVNAIRSLRIMAPDYIFYRDPMWLNCSVIDLDYNQIYSIKWFKDNDEMYRFITADETTPRTFYDTPGIVIDVSQILLFS